MKGSATSIIILASHLQVHMAAISSLQSEVESLNQKLGEVTRQKDAREAMASQR